MRAVALTPSLYKPYGEVIAARADVTPVAANLGFAKRYNRLAPLENLRPGDATANLCVFRCDPMLPAGRTRFDVKLLERHAGSTQVFVPMAGVTRYLVIVCLGGDAPDLGTLAAFVATGAQGISYKPGVWHHPLVAMDQGGDFACVVHENGEEDDCDVFNLSQVVPVEVGPSS